MARKKSTKKKKNHGPYLVIALLLIAVAAVAFIPTETSGKESERLALANDSTLEMVIIPKELSNEMISYEGFTVAFNPEMHQPNYVVWTLDPSETTGDFSRNSVQFLEDPNVKGCAKLSDYKSSGFDRGHMAPAADMKWSQQSMADCHFLTNICPQEKSLNAGAWATVEKNSRIWAKKFGPLVIICGPILSDKMTRTIGTTPVPVPERFFKVILAPEADEPMGIAFIMPNSHVEGGAQSTVVSIDEVEQITGFDFFSALPDDVEQKIEAQSKLRIWNK